MSGAKLPFIHISLRAREQLYFTAYEQPFTQSLLSVTHCCSSHPHYVRLSHFPMFSISRIAVLEESNCTQNYSCNEPSCHEHVCYIVLALPGPYLFFNSCQLHRAGLCPWGNRGKANSCPPPLPVHKNRFELLCALLKT
jgi:hypothetical protein